MRLNNKVNFLFLLYFLITLSAISQKPVYLIANTGSYSTISGTLLTGLVDEDDEAEELNIGFPFIFNGTSYTSMYISTNGTISFNRDYDDYSNDFNSLENTDLIAAFWTDLESLNTSNPFSSIQYLKEGSGTNHTITIQWDRMQTCCDFVSGNEVISFQVKLYETNGKIEFRYKKNLPYTNSFDNLFNPYDVDEPYYSNTASVGFRFAENLSSIEDDSYLSVNVLSRSATISSTTSHNDVSWINDIDDGLVLTFSINPIAPILSLSAPTGTITSNCAGIPSVDYATFDVIGSNLSSTLTVSAPSGFEISNVSNTSYASSLSLTPVSNTVSQTVYIRLSSSATTNGAYGTITATSSGATTVTTTVSSTTVDPPSFTGTGTTYNLCKDATYLISLTVSNSYNGWSTSSNTITVNNGYVTAGTSTGPYTVSYTDACAQTVSATVTVGDSDISPAIIDGQASYKINNTNPIPQGPTASLYVGYNGYNYFSATKPINTGYYRANNVDLSTKTAGCPYPFYIFRCTTCPD
jgi:hypothetical protein